MKKAVMAGILLAITLPFSAFAQTPDPGIMADLVSQVQELQDEVRNMRGQLEEQARELENLKRRQRDQYLDIDQRLSDMRNNQPVSSGTANTSATTSAPAMEQGGDVPEVRAPVESEMSVTVIEEPAAEIIEVAPNPEAEKAAYDQAFQALKDLRYADAAASFQSFLDQYPNSEYADNAQYWLGESYYVTRNYDIALKAFQDLMDNYPDSPKVADALLKVGYTHYELQQWDSARAALMQVQENYPDTTLSRLAESRLRSMRMEGHY